MKRGRMVGSVLGSISVTLAAVAYCSLAPFAQGVILAALIAVPGSIAAISLGSWRLGVMALLIMGGEVLALSVGSAMPRGDYFALGVGALLALLGGYFLVSSRRARTSTGTPIGERLG